MTISSELFDDGKGLHITVSGRFDASLLDAFRRSFEEADSVSISHYTVDLEDTVHLDSSALGMLLVSA